MNHIAATGSSLWPNEAVAKPGADPFDWATCQKRGGKTLTLTKQMLNKTDAKLVVWSCRHYVTYGVDCQGQQFELEGLGRNNKQIS